MTPGGWWRAWNAQPWLLLGLAVSSWVYGRGLLALWEKAGVGRGVSKARAAAFEGGLCVLFVALVSPLDAVSGALFWAHMLQHMLLMLVAAPLLALGAPAFVLLWALPLRGRQRLGAWLRRLEAWYSPRALLWQPLALWCLYALTLWVWHLPALYQAALRRPLVHDGEHAAFLLAAVLFWRVLLDPVGRRRLSRGAGVLYLFTTSLQASALGIFMTLSPRIWYPAYAATAPTWGLTPLQDQQLAGLIMWMPACMIYAIAAAALFAAWLGEAPPEREVEVEELRCGTSG